MEFRLEEEESERKFGLVGREKNIERISFDTSILQDIEGYQRRELSDTRNLGAEEFHEHFYLLLEVHRGERFKQMVCSR